MKEIKYSDILHVNYIIDEYYKYLALIDVAVKIQNQDNSKQALVIINDVLKASSNCKKIDIFQRVSLNIIISSKFFILINIDVAYKLLDECLISLREVNNYLVDKCELIIIISRNYFEQNNINKAQDLLEECIRYADDIIEKSYKFEILAKIAKELYNQGNIEKSKELLNRSFNNLLKLNQTREESAILRNIALEFLKQRFFEEAFLCLNKITDEIEKDYTIIDISKQLVKFGLIEQAISFAQEMTCNSLKSSVFTFISSELFKENKKSDSTDIIEKSIEFATLIKDDFITNKNRFSEISDELYNQGKIKESFKILKDYLIVKSKLSQHEQNSFLKEIGICFLNENKIEQGIFCLKKSKYGNLKNISTELSSNGLLEVSIKCTQEIDDLYDRCISLTFISSQLYKRLRTDEAIIIIEQSLFFAKLIDDVYYKIRALTDISVELYIQNKIKLSIKVLSEAIELLQCCDSSTNDELLRYLTSKIVECGNFELALVYTDKISNIYWRFKSLVIISHELYKKDNYGKAHKVAQDAILLIYEMNDHYFRNKSLGHISIMFAQQKNTRLSFKYAMEINVDVIDLLSDNLIRNDTIKEIAVELLKYGYESEFLACLNLLSDNKSRSILFLNTSNYFRLEQEPEDDEFFMMEALKCARNIENNIEKNNLLERICCEFVKRSNLNLAVQICHEINDTFKRQLCLKSIAENICEQISWQGALGSVNKLESPEAKKYYLKGLAELYDITNSNKKMILYARQYYQNDIASMELLLQQYALHELFFDDVSDSKLERLNRSLNIQWAIDIKNSFSVN